MGLDVYMFPEKLLSAHKVVYKLVSRIEVELELFVLPCEDHVHSWGSQFRSVVLEIILF